jgi:DNA-binding NarL/FixJ family response regulator
MISVGIIEDHPIYRSGLIQVIDHATDLTLNTTAGSVEEYQQARPDHCNVLVLDLDLPGVSGPEAVGAVSPWADAVLIVSGSEAYGWVAEAMAAGARGCLTKHAEDFELLEAIRAVAQGHTFVTPTLALYVLNGAPGLTPRQREILELVADGESDQEIADALHLTTSGVQGHLDRIGERTGCRRRSALTQLARELGIKRRPQVR